MSGTVEQIDDFEVSGNTADVETAPPETPSLETPPDPQPPIEAGPKAEPETPADRTPTPRNPDGTYAKRPTNYEAKRDPQARIGQMQWDKAESERARIAAEAERDTLRRELDAARQDRQPRTENREPEPAKAATVADVIRQPAIDRPVLSDAEFFTQFPDASTTDYYRYVSRYELAAEKAADQHVARQQQYATAIDRTVENGKKAFPDFEAALTRTAQAQLSFGPVLSDLIATEPLGHALAYELATHHEILRRLSSLPAPAATREAFRMLSRLEVATTGSTSPAPVVSRAHPPIQPVGSSPQVSDEPPDPDRTDNFDAHVGYYSRKDRARR